MYYSKNSDLKISLLLVNIIVNTECQQRQNNAAGLYPGLDKQKIQCKIENIFIPIVFFKCFGAQKNRLIETVLLSTHNIYFG